MAASEVDDYGALKAPLLKRFRLTEGGYLKKFKNSRIEPGETPEQFTERLRRYLEKWREMAGFEQNHEGLEKLILRDQYFFDVRQSTTNLLGGPKRLVIITRHYPTDSCSHKDNRSEVHAHDDGSTMQVSQPINQPFRTKHCVNCGLNNHDSSERRKPRVQRNSSNADIVCFQCKQMGHKRN